MAETLETLVRDMSDNRPPATRPPLSQEVAGRSRFEAIADRTARRAAHLEEILDVMFAAARPDPVAGPQLLRPLWAEEALHRIYTMMRLVDAQNQRAGAMDGSAADVGPELAMAHGLAALYRSLEQNCNSGRAIPSSQVLSDMVARLVGLFGAAAGDITLITSIEPLSLQPYRRRALALAAGELVMNALLHGFADRTRGWVGTSLSLVTPGSARLQVVDDGGAGAGHQPNIRHGVAAGLADLLAGDLAYYWTTHLTIAEITFPLEAGESSVSAREVSWVCPAGPVRLRHRAGQRSR